MCEHDDDDSLGIIRLTDGRLAPDHLFHGSGLIGIPEPALVIEFHEPQLVVRSDFDDRIGAIGRGLGGITWSEIGAKGLVGSAARSEEHQGTRGRSQSRQRFIHKTSQEPIAGM